MMNRYTDFILILAIMQLMSCASSRFFRHQDIPVSGGNYVVGTRVYEWIDSSRTDIFSGKEGMFRRIIVQVWYPGKRVGDVYEKFSYFQNDEITAEKLASHFSVPKFFVAGAVDLRTNALMNIEPLKGKIPYPLILFSHGRGGYKHQNSIQCEELASRGYVVVAVNHTYDSFITIFQDGSSAPFLSGKSNGAGIVAKPTITTPEKLELRVNDIQFVIDQIENFGSRDSLFGMIDMNTIGMFGHSFGGATTIAMASKNSQVDAAAGLDAWFIPLADSLLQKGMKIPFLHIGQDKWVGMPENYERMRTLMDNSSAQVHHFPTARMKHYDFTDGPQFSGSAKVLIPFFSWEDRSEMRAMLNTMLVAFFDYHLKKKNTETINQTASRFSTILVN